MNIFIFCRLFFLFKTTHMILIDKKKFKNYEWEFIEYLYQTYANNENINALLKNHFFGLWAFPKWQTNFFNESYCLKLNLNDVSSMVVNLLHETYAIYYKCQLVTKGILSLDNLKEASHIVYQHYKLDFINQNQDKTHPFTHVILNSCLKYIY